MRSRLGSRQITESVSDVVCRVGHRAQILVGRDLGGTVAEEARRLGLTIEADPSGRLVTDADLDPLPDAAQRYLRYMGVVGRPRDRSFTAQFRGRFRMRQGLPWMPVESFQLNTATPVVRIFHMRIDFAGFIPMVGRDVYAAGHGLMHGKLLNVVTVVHGEGPEFDIGELTTYLNDAVFLAPSMLLADTVTWTAIDDDHFAIALTDAGHNVTALITVDGRGTPVDFESNDRWAALPEGLTRARWRTPMADWTIVDGRARALSGSAIWELDEGPYEYGRLASSSEAVRYNTPPG